MGQHYIPRQYLRHFSTASDRDKIWMYDKRHPTEPNLLPIATVVQSAGFYTDSDERALSQNIEGPAQRPLDLLRSGQSVDSEGRTTVSLYIESMIKRVPASRNRLLSQLPSVKQDVIADTMSNLEAVAAKLKKTPPELHREIEEWDQEVKATDVSDRHPIVSRQWTSPEIVGCLYSMTWRVIKSGEDCFVTSDNPVFYDEGLGLQNRYSEASFPLGTKLALHASWNGPRAGLLFSNGSSSIIDEINRRTAFNTTRFALYHTKSIAISSLISTERPQLHAISWQ